MTTALNITAALEAARTLDPHVLSLPKKQLEGIAYKILRSRFKPFLESAVKELIAAPQTEAKAVLGRLIDYRTRVVASQQKVAEELIQDFRYALMNVIRDEAFMRGRPENPEKFCSVHVAKGRIDEGMPGIKRALAELDDICHSVTPVFAESRVNQATASQSSNDDRRLIALETELEVQQLLRTARVHLNFGETPTDQLRGWTEALRVLTTHKHFAYMTGGFVPHFDRLKTARSLRLQLFAAQQERIVAHQYRVHGDDVRVPRIAERNPLSDVTLYVVTRGWTTIASDMIAKIDRSDLEAQLKEEHGEDIQVFTA